MSRIARLAFLVAAYTTSAAGADHWVRIVSGPFEVLTPAGERAARQQMMQAEEFRHVVGELFGAKDINTVWPLRIVVLKNAKSDLPGSIAMGRDAWMSVAAAGDPSAPEWRNACARILIGDNTGRLPPGIEDGVVALVSTLEVNGPKLTLGTPPPAAGRTRDWARMHLFATQPEYAGRLRILLSNLAHGGEYDAACRNAFEKPAAEMEKRVDAYFAAGKFEAVPFSGRALSEKDFVVRDVETYDGRIAFADLLLADPAKSAAAQSAYRALTGTEALEGTAMLAAARHDPAAAKAFEGATKAGSKNPRAWLGTGSKEGAIKAIELNPKWAEPHVRLAELATAPNVKAAELGKAAALATRDVGLWKRAALAYAAANQFPEAAKAWAGAERAATTDAEREQLRQARMDNERQRAEFDAAERKRIADDEARDLERIRQQSMAEVKAAETKANQQMAAGGAVPSKPQAWWVDPAGPAQTVEGTLVRVDCLSGGRSRWTLQTSASKTPLILLVRDPGKIALRGENQKSMGCGVQRPAHTVTVEFAPGRDPKLGTTGEIQTVEFR